MERTDPCAGAGIFFALLQHYCFVFAFLCYDPYFQGFLAVFDVYVCMDGWIKLYICMYAYIYAFMVYAALMDVYVYAYISVYVNVGLCLRLYLNYLYIHIYLYLYLHALQVHTYSIVCMHLFMHVYICVCVREYFIRVVNLNLGSVLKGV